LCQRALGFADADRKRAALGLAGFDEELAEEVRFSRTAPSVRAFISRAGASKGSNTFAVGIFKVDKGALSAAVQEHGKRKAPPVTAAAAA